MFTQSLKAREVCLRFETQPRLLGEVALYLKYDCHCSIRHSLRYKRGKEKGSKEDSQLKELIKFQKNWFFYGSEQWLKAAGLSRHYYSISLFRYREFVFTAF